ncbi:MAG: hypothetical protein J07HX5_00316 [halophilic archaeon J07HX5]|nr:MAG: hypothetical protein J07HX5_00316 [halophilic archaeon J07HX5]
MSVSFIYADKPRGIRLGPALPSSYPPTPEAVGFRLVSVEMTWWRRGHTVQNASSVYCVAGVRSSGDCGRRLRRRWLNVRTRSDLLHIDSAGATPVVHRVSSFRRPAGQDSRTRRPQTDCRTRSTGSKHRLEQATRRSPVTGVSPWFARGVGRGVTCAGVSTYTRHPDGALLGMAAHTDCG